MTVTISCCIYMITMVACISYRKCGLWFQVSSSERIQHTVPKVSVFIINSRILIRNFWGDCSRFPLSGLGSSRDKS